MPGVATAPELERVISEFIDALRSGIRVEAVILYGSYARGCPHEWSGIDLAVISPDFEGIPLPKRQSMLSELTWDRTDSRIDPMGFSSSEYRNASRVYFLGHAVKTGKVVYEAPAEE
jgi:predicted nucleotidyltransferase